MLTNGFGLPALRLIDNYRSQRKRVHNLYSEWLAVMFGYQQVRFWDHFCSTFFQQICFLYILRTSFGDENTRYFSAENVEDVIKTLERTSVFMSIQFQNNLLNGNDNKSHFLVSTWQEVSLTVNNFKIKKTKSSGCENLLGVKFDSKLRFGQHNSDFPRIASRKIHVLARVTSFMNLSK